MTLTILPTRSNLFSKKLFFIRKLCLIFLRRFKNEKKILIFEKNIKKVNDLKTNFHKNNFIKDKKTGYLTCEFIKFSFLFQKLICFFSDYGTIQMRQFKSFLNIQGKIYKNVFARKKKSFYFIKNFKKLKDKHFFWFYEYDKNRYLGKVQKISRNYHLFNPKILLDIITEESKKNSIKGFSKKALDFIFKILKRKIKTIIIGISETSMKRGLFKNKIIDDWGKNNIIYKKIKAFQDFKLKSKLENKIKCSVRKFKNKKKIFGNTLKNQNSKFFFLTKPLVSIEEERKTQQTEDILSRTNKTLMTLLNEILTGRIEELKKATLCLCQYKPSEMRFFEKKVEKQNLSIIKRHQKPAKKKKKNFIENYKQYQNHLFKTNCYISGIDCFLFLKKEPLFKNCELPVALWIILMMDFNIRFQNKIKK
jgi:hypothetical protein